MGLLTVSVRFTSISAERLVTSLPPRIQFSINLTVPASEPFRKENQYILPFVFSIASTPPVVQFTFKGQAVVVSGDEKEITELEKGVRSKKLPMPVMQAILTNSIAEAIVLARSLGVPPPLPMPLQPQQAYTPKGEKKNKFEQESVI